jgi:HAD superfamily hydrolase (TIGR01509 family)
VDFQYGALFDMDGVIVDNGRYHVLAFAEWCREQKVDFDQAYFEANLFGKQNGDIFRSLLGHELPPDEVWIQHLHKEALYREVYADHRKPVDGLIEFMKDLKNHGFGLAVATSGPPENVAFVMEGIGAEGLFDKIITSDDVTRGKPDPQVFLLAAEKLGLPAGRCVVFEDSVAGAQGAAAAGAALVGVATGHDQLPHAARMIRDFTGITAEQTAGLILAHPD